MSVSAREDQLEKVYELLDTAWSRADDRQLVDVRRDVGLSIHYLETVFLGEGLDQLDDVDRHLENAASATHNSAVLEPVRNARQLLESVRVEQERSATCPECEGEYDPVSDRTEMNLGKPEYCSLACYLAAGDEGGESGV